MTLADKVKKHQQDSRIDEDPQNVMIIPATPSDHSKKPDMSIVTSEYSIVSSKNDKGVNCSHNSSFLKTA